MWNTDVSQGPRGITRPFDWFTRPFDWFMTGLYPYLPVFTLIYPYFTRIYPYLPFIWPCASPRAAETASFTDRREGNGRAHGRHFVILTVKSVLRVKKDH